MTTLPDLAVGSVVSETRIDDIVPDTSSFDENAASGIRLS